MMITLLTTLMTVAGLVYLPVFVCLSVFQHNVSKTNAARITRLDIEILHDES